MRLTSITDVSNLKDLDKVGIYVTKAFFEIQKALNNNLDFETNFAANIQTVQFLSAGA